MTCNSLRVDRVFKTYRSNESPRQYIRDGYQPSCLNSFNKSGRKYPPDPSLASADKGRLIFGRVGRDGLVASARRAVRVCTYSQPHSRTEPQRIRFLPWVALRGIEQEVTEVTENSTSPPFSLFAPVQSADAPAEVHKFGVCPLIPARLPASPFSSSG